MKNHKIKYHSTRSTSSLRSTFLQTVLQGISTDGGLFVPERVPQLPLSDINLLSSRTYAQRAAHVLKCWETDMSGLEIDELVNTAYSDNFDHPDIAPLVHLRGNQYMLELWHGPTSAFKDMALQLMPLFFSAAVERDNVEQDLEYLILVATSGDTGKAAMEGFKDRKHTQILVFYPHDGVSDLQAKQMLTQAGDNVGVMGVGGDFDDCQNAVKATFANPDFNQQLLVEYGVKLSSANSINWGRVLPQIVYYVHAYVELIEQNKIKLGGQFDVAVPTGNFGNILSAYYAQRMGLPIRKLICASNENNILTDFLQTGIYDISTRSLMQTPSPSMDILVSSNLERLLYHLMGDAELIRFLMAALKQGRRFVIDGQTQRKLQDLFYADSVSNQETLDTIKLVYDQYNYLMDPHTAVAQTVVERYLESGGGGDIPIVTLSTAHWAKFGQDVYKALKGIPVGQEQVPKLEGLSGLDILKRVRKLAPGSSIPRSLAGLDRIEVMHDRKCERTTEGVQKCIIDFMGDG